MARLAPQLASGVAGEATLLRAGGSTMIAVTLEGLAPGSAHAGHIHGGGCSGPILFTLSAIVVDSAGRGQATPMVDAPLDAATWSVQYHASDSPPGPPISCGGVERVGAGRATLGSESRTAPSGDAGDRRGRRARTPALPRGADAADGGPATVAG